MMVVDLALDLSHSKQRMRKPIFLSLLITPITLNLKKRIRMNNENCSYNNAER